MTTTITRIAAGLLVGAGLAIGSTGLAPVAIADSDSGRSNTTSQSDGAKQKANPQRTGPIGLNGNRPPRQAKHFPARLDQFKHLPFDPAMPGGD